MIACLGWGSLVWNLDGLPVKTLRSDLPVLPWTRCAEGECGDWQRDGPCVSVEFVRQSKDGRLTLVLYDAAAPVQSLWACMTVDDLPAAVKALAEREGCKEEYIGRWSRGQADPKKIPDLEVWAIDRDIEHVIWTALGPKFCDLQVAPTEDQAVAYLRKISEEGSDAKAKKYVRQTPQQINTAYRRCIVRCLGSEWEVDRECV